MPDEDKIRPIESTSKSQHLVVLDGWRCMSILFVLIGHLAPLNFGSIQLNSPFATSGMVIFFTLSGFLITQSLIGGIRLYNFAIRRIFRIVPLAWIAIAVLAIFGKYSASYIYANLFFYSNLPDQKLLEGGGHFWSLCVEMQIYLVLAILAGALKKHAKFLIPVALICVTFLRVAAGRYTDIVTWFRCDEILAGSVLSLVYSGYFSSKFRYILGKINPIAVIPILFASSYPDFGPLNYLRPYISTIMVGSTLYKPSFYAIYLSELPIVKYIARISYAIYVIHGMLMSSWLGSGDRLIKYLKRPLMIVITFSLAHYSTIRFEEPVNRLAKRLTIH